jgi:hypothetical protein
MPCAVVLIVVLNLTLLFLHLNTLIFNCHDAMNRSDPLVVLITLPLTIRSAQGTNSSFGFGSLELVA